MPLGQSQGEFVDEDYCVVQDITLTAGQQIIGASQALDDDAPFFWRTFSADGLAADGTTSYTNFSVWWRNANGRYMSNAPVRINNIQGVGPMPYVRNPEVPYPKNGQISSDFIENQNSGGPFTIQVAYHGVKRFSAACAPSLCGTEKAKSS
jgi:hypothetical protein